MITNSNITQEEILSNCIYTDSVQYGDIFSWQSFMDIHDSGSFQDLDGSGELLIDGKRVLNAVLGLSNQTVQFKDRFTISFDDLYDILGDRISFLWQQNSVNV